MARHLGSDPNTTGLMDSDVTVAIGRSQLLPGDILDDVVRHSAESSDHVTSWDAAVQIGSGWNIYTLLD